jgi:hypothetical protein
MKKDDFLGILLSRNMVFDSRASLALQGEVYFISFYNIFEGRVFGGQKI